MWRKARDTESLPGDMLEGDDQFDKEVDVVGPLLLGLAFIVIATVVIMVATH